MCARLRGEIRDMGERVKALLKHDEFKGEQAFLGQHAVLVRCDYMPSAYIDDYTQKTYTARQVAKMMEKAHEKSKDLAVELRRICDSI